MCIYCLLDILAYFKLEHSSMNVSKTGWSYFNIQYKADVIYKYRTILKKKKSKISPIFKGERKKNALKMV